MKYFFFLFIVFVTAPLFAQENIHYINVNGTSEVTRIADQASFTVEIKTIDDALEISKSLNDKNSGELLAILKEFGIRSSDISITPIKIGKNIIYDRDRQPKQKGFFAVVDISFLLKDLSKYYEFTNKLVTNNSFEVSKSSYSISDYETQHKIAIENALKAAKEKADYMAKTLGVSLGKVLEIDENNNYQTYANPFNSVTVERSDNSDISGKVVLKRSVRVKFSIN